MRFSIAAALVVLATIVPFGVHARTMVISDVRRIIDISTPTISPDGKHIVCLFSKPQYSQNDTETDVLLVDIATGAQRMLTHGRHNVSRPQWSPSGEYIAFIARESDKDTAENQIFVMPAHGGAATQITHAPNDVDVFAWRPDGGAIAYVAADEQPNKAAIARGHDYFEVGNDPYLTTAAPTPLRLWVISANGGVAQRITSGTWSLAAPDVPVQLSWSPNGSDVVLTRVPTPHTGDGDRSTIVVVDVVTKRVRKLTSHDHFEGYPMFSPDGSKIAYVYSLNGDVMNEGNVFVAPAGGGDGVNIQRHLDRDANGAVWMPDSKSVLIGAPDGTRTSLWLQPIEGLPRKLNLGPIDPSNDNGIDVTVGAHGAIAFSGYTHTQPTELYYMRSSTDAPRRLTNFNHDIASLNLGPNEGSNIDFYDYIQLVASHGYLVFQPNYRGSDNLGTAYMYATWNDGGDGPGRDIMGGLEAVEKLGIVDTSRIAVGGWSNGGYMTSWLIGHYQGWKAAVLGAAYTDCYDDYNLSDSNVSEVHYFKGSPWVDNYMQACHEQSSITYWKNMKTPALIFSNTGDVRVTITQSYAIYHALKDNHVPVKFIAWPESGHEISGPVRIEDLYRLWLDWLDRYLK
jgi:dipeptidyl aminopeptidase/acylaminoacyl peptidase